MAGRPSTGKAKPERERSAAFRAARVAAGQVSLNGTWIAKASMDYIDAVKAETGVANRGEAIDECVRRLKERK